MDDPTPALIPFAHDYRGAGVLMHVTSLPCRYGIGDLGPTSYAWIDRLKEAGQRCWQTLPLGPTGDGFSPYTPTSTFAGNILLISPDQLVDDGLLTANEIDDVSFPADHVDFGAVTEWKRSVLQQAWSRFQSNGSSDLREGFDTFREQQSHWLSDFALFIAIKEQHNNVHYREWEEALVQRDEAALRAKRADLAERIEACCFNQYLFYRQSEKLNQYAKAHGVHILGDVPFFVSSDSSDVWSNPDMFLLDDRQQPLYVAGVPPDYFSEFGQLWGNPVYDWEALQRHGYQWWIDRLRALLAQTNVLRLDHFRAFEAAWHTAAGADNAIGGEWKPGPGADFFHRIQEALGGLPFVAEDLGHITDDVRELRKQFHLPGMLVIQFSFDGDPHNPFLPQNFIHNAVGYTGTHDNDTTRGWYNSLRPDQQELVWRMVQRPPAGEDQVASQFIDLTWRSAAALAIAPLQDLLNLGSEGRMNTPGVAYGNWGWRCTDQMLAEANFAHLRWLTEDSGRTA